MATVTPLTGTPIAEPTDNIVDLLETPDGALWLEKYANLRFATTAARDAAIPVPEAGMVANIGTSAANRYWSWYDGTQWARMQPNGGTSSATFAAGASITPSSGAVSHGLGVTPRAVVVTAIVSGTARLNAQVDSGSVNSTTFTFKITREDSTFGSSTPISVYWVAIP